MHDSYLPTVSELFNFLAAKESNKGWWRCRCPVHESRHWNSLTLAIRAGDTVPVVFWCHAGCTYGEITAELERQGMWPVQPDPWRLPPPTEPELDAEAARKWAYLVRIDSELRPAKGSQVERYLLERGIKLLPEHELGFHPRLWHRVSVKSPVPRCGKTTLLDAGEMVCARVVNTANVSTSAMFRLVDAHRPTLLIDECDSFLKKNDELRGIINAGHKKGGKVIRTTGDDFEVRAFLCFAPAMLAGIGRLPDTIEDRSIEIMLVRALANERPYPITKATRRQAAILRRKAARWIDDNSAALATLDPDMPDFLYNREADNWRPLFAIAQQVGGKFPAIVRQCARKMRRAADNDDALATLALLHIREFFDGLEGGVTQATHIRPISIVNDLLQRDDAAWMEVPPRGKELTTQRLGTLLREFKIKSSPQRNRDQDGKVVRYYFYKDFEDAFKRYLS